MSERRWMVVCWLHNTAPGQYAGWGGGAVILYWSRNGGWVDSERFDVARIFTEYEAAAALRDLSKSSRLVELIDLEE